MKKSRKIMEEAWRMQEEMARIQRLGLPEAEMQTIQDLMSRAFAVLSHAGRDMAKAEAEDSYMRQLELPLGVDQ